MNKTSRPISIALYVACYVIWLVLCVALLWLIFQLPTNILDFAYLLGATQMMAALVERLCMIPVVLAVVAAGILLENSLREGVPLGLLWRRAAKAALWIVGVIAFSYALHFAVVTIRLS